MVTVAGCRSQMGTPAKGEPVADALVLAGLDGRAFDPDTLKTPGKKSLVTFWSTTCGTCLDELPELQRVSDRHPDCQVATVVVKGSPEHAADLRDRLGIRVPILLDSHSDLRHMLGIRATPTTYALDETGAATRFVVGGYGYERLRRLCE